MRPAQQRGYILLPVIVVITLVAAIALLMNTESALESNTAARELDARQADYVAAAGINHALWQAAQQGCGPYTDITNWSLGSDQYSTSLTTDLGATAAYAVTVDQDSWIRDDLPADNYAVDDRLHIRNQGGVIERPLYRYDLSAIPPKGTILSAVARFYVSRAHAEGPVDIHRVTADWIETDATWDSTNAAIDGAVLASIPVQPAAGVWVSVNLTAQVQAWVNGEPNFGITLNAASAGVHADYASRESANAPYLEVVVGAPPTSPALLKSVGRLANGVTRAAIDAKVTLVQQPASFVQWQHDAAAGVDAYIWEFRPTTNYGTDSETWVSQSAFNTSLSLLKFDVDKLLPGTRILNATLSLMHQSGNNTNVPVSAHRIANAWNEATVTWRQRDAGVDWDTWGGDLDQRAVSTTLVGPVSGIRYEWDLTSLVQGWAGHIYPNYGVALHTSQNGSIGERFYTSDEIDATRRPRLTITYSCACGEVCVAPQGSGNLLMAVTNPTVLVAEDQQARELFESWGYTVSVVSESDSQATYDAAVSANDVVFISETVNSNSVGSKLAGATIGVVSQDGDYNADLGLAGGGALKVGVEINVTDTDHYITRVFAAGPLPVYAAGMEQLIVSSAPSAGQQVLADVGGDASLVVLEKGDAMEGGGNAAGRRVMLPLGTRYRFDWDRLNANGRMLVQRALAWGLGADKPPGIPLLMVVVNPASLSAQESARQTLIESWGYAVNLIDESDSQANFDAALAANGVAYVGESVNPGNLGTKLLAATIGIVSEDIVVGETLQIGKNGGFLSSDKIDITDNTHLITSGLALGPTTIVTSPQSLVFFNSSTSSGQLVLGKANSGAGAFKDSLVTVDIGMELESKGSLAAGKRVQLPWGASGFDINALNADGLTIMQRALEWAAGAELSTGPIAHWKLDETSGSTAVDSEGGHDGTLLNGPAWTPGQVDGALAFDGTDDYVHLTSHAELDDLFDGGATVMAWINPASWGGNGYGRIFDKSSSPSATGDGWAIHLDKDNGGLNFGQGFNGGRGWWRFAESSIDFDTWQHIALAYDASSTSNDPIAYLNGSPVAVTRVDSPSGPVRSDAALDLRLGSDASVTLNVFDGKIDDARIYDHMLGAAEIAALAGLGTVAHWKLDDGAGLTAIDSEGGHHGTLTNGPAWVAGALGDALDFDGSNDYVDAGTFDVSGSGITMMGWFNADVIATDDGRIVSKANGPNEADAWWQLSTTDVGASRFLRMRIKAGGTTTTFADNSVNLVTDQWYFAVATYDNASGSMKLYLDGVEIRSGTHALGGALDTDPSVPVALGANGTAERFFNGVLDDLRVYNYALPAAEIYAIFDAVDVPSPTGYVERYQPWSANVDNAWEAVDLSVYGVPANAVVEVAIVNTAATRERWGGVRTAGSSLERRFQLHEVEAGGVDAVTLHVQTDASGRIEHYAENQAEVTFILLGYWLGASYVELYDNFTIIDGGSWRVHDFGAEGVAAGSIAEVVMVNTSFSREHLAGVRRLGAGYQRRFSLQEAESGGIDALSIMVQTDAAGRAEVYGPDPDDVDLYAVGYWSTPPGTYSEVGAVSGQVGVAAAWQSTDLSGYGVPDGATAQFVLANGAASAHAPMGLRASGSDLDRLIDLQEAESGGSDLATMHVNVNSSIEAGWYVESGITERSFYPVGWWLPAP